MHTSTQLEEILRNLEPNPEHLVPTWPYASTFTNVPWSQPEPLCAEPRTSQKTATCYPEHGKSSGMQRDFSGQGKEFQGRGGNLSYGASQLCTRKITGTELSSPLWTCTFTQGKRTNVTLPQVDNSSCMMCIMRQTAQDCSLLNSYLEERSTHWFVKFGQSSRSTHYTTQISQILL